MLDALLGGGFSLLGGLLNQRAQDKRMKKIMAHLEAVTAWQKQNLATALNDVSSAEQTFRADPGRAKVRSEFNTLLENPSALTDQMVSAQKQAALSSSASNAAQAGDALSADLQRRGLGGSPIGASLRRGLFSDASRDANTLAAGIDTNAALTRRRDKERVLASYDAWNSSDLDRAYSFARDRAGILSGVNYQNSLALTG